MAAAITSASRIQPPIPISLVRSRSRLLRVLFPLLLTIAHAPFPDPRAAGRAARAPALGWAFAYFFLLLSSYYVLRPVRDALAVELGAQALQRLFTATLAAMLAVVPLFGWLASRLPRARLLPACTRSSSSTCSPSPWSSTRACFSCGSASSTCS
jgi:hypothetical protein